MEELASSQSPFAVLTLIAAPAILTNATSTLANSTINRMLHTRDRMRALFAESRAGGLSEQEAVHLLTQVGRVEKQATLLLRALGPIYVALGAFAGATLITLLGEGLSALLGEIWFHALAFVGVALGLVGVAGLVFCSVMLFQATQVSMATIREEAALIRQRQARRASAPHSG